MRTFDVVVAVRIHDAPSLTPEQVQILFDQDLGGIEGYPDARIRMRTVDVKAT